MDGTIRLATLSPLQTPGNPKENLSAMLAAVAQLIHADIVVFPQLALSSPSCGSLFSNHSLLEDCRAALMQFCEATRQNSAYYLVGLPIRGQNGTISATAVVQAGQVRAMVPALGTPAPGLASPTPEECKAGFTVLGCGGLRFCLLPCSPPELPRYMPLIENTGCRLVVVPACMPAKAGQMPQVVHTLEVVSSAWDCAVALCSTGCGGSSAPYVYGGLSAVYEKGRQLAFAASLQQATTTLCDIDPLLLGSAYAAEPPKFVTRPTPKPELLRQVSPDPFLASTTHRQGLFLELFQLQATSLAARMQNTGHNRLVLGLSGGLDSTLAALVSLRALELLSLSKEHLICVTMPGFGTGNQTKGSAQALAAGLGLSLREIPIGEACKNHMDAIGHTGTPDIAYENAQARERTQILLDIANMEQGLVVGTGDLSEAALGWCTFGGDQLASFNVNACLTKSMVRGVVAQLAESTAFAPVADILHGILETPVSPELLPIAAGESIVQKTEEILGPYPLHEFFLYYLLAYRMPPQRILEYACIAFPEHPRGFILQKLQLFLRRFVAGQFKRASAPDSAEIFTPSLHPLSFQLPSDLSQTLPWSRLESL